jgi:hypothetical protein
MSFSDGATLLLLVFAGVWIGIFSVGAALVATAKLARKLNKDPKRDLWK